jgi:hypothetical protein
MSTALDALRGAVESAVSPLATDAQLAGLLSAVRCERSFHPEMDREAYQLLNAALTELQVRRAAAAAGGAP